MDHAAVNAKPVELYVSCPWGAFATFDEIVRSYQADGYVKCVSVVRKVWNDTAMAFRPMIITKFKLKGTGGA